MYRHTCIFFDMIKLSCMCKNKAKNYVFSNGLQASSSSKSDDSCTVKEQPFAHTPVAKEGRRQLPPIPSPDTQLAMASEIKQRQNVSPRTGSNGHGQLFTEYKLMAE